MRLKFNTNNRELSLRIPVRTKGDPLMVIRVRDRDKPYTYFTNRTQRVKDKFVFTIRLPQTPKKAVIEVYNKENGDLPKGVDPSFQVGKIKVEKLKKQLNIFDADSQRVQRFIKFAQEFSRDAGILSAGRSIYTSDEGDFRIDYLDVIKDRMTGRVLTTPARISRDRGVIEVSKKHFKNYTVPMRMAILLHEFSHYYVNEDSTSEMEADLNALLMYLGLGYPRVEAHQAFLTVFKGSPSNENKKRYGVIKNFINNFENHKFKRVA